MKSKSYLFSCFLCFQEEVFKVKKITHPGSLILTKFFPDPGGKKAPYPGSVTLVSMLAF
jgi:hypothetical protein